MVRLRALVPTDVAGHVAELLRDRLGAPVTVVAGPVADHSWVDATPATLPDLAVLDAVPAWADLLHLPEIPVHLRLAGDPDWTDAASRLFRPFAASPRVWLCPLSHPGAPPGMHALTLAPGAAFGTGAHETTAGALALLDALLAAEPGPVDRVLDVGCGSGILAVAALLLGARQTVGVDLSEPAIAAARETAARNGVAPRAAFVHGSLHDAAGAFDVIVANVPASVLLNLASGIRARAPRHVILSGALHGEAARVVAAYGPDFGLVERRDGPSFSAVHLRRKR